MLTKNLTLIAFCTIILANNVINSTANIFRKNALPMAIAIIGGTTVNYKINQLYLQKQDEYEKYVLPITPLMPKADADRCKKLLLERAGKKVDSKTIDQIQFRETKGFNYGSTINLKGQTIMNLKLDEGIILSCLFGPGDFSKDWFFGLIKGYIHNEFTPLHELSHIYHQDGQSVAKKTKLLATTATSCCLFYISKAAKLSMFLKRLPVAPLALGGCIFFERLSRYQAECRADDFAIDCLKENGNIKQLKQAKHFFNNYEYLDNNSSVLPPALFMKLKEQYPTIAQAIHLIDDVHPFNESRTLKIQEAIAELEAAELLKQKNKPKWHHCFFDLFKKNKNSKEANT